MEIIVRKSGDDYASYALKGLCKRRKILAGLSLISHFKLCYYSAMIVKYPKCYLAFSFSLLILILGLLQQTVNPLLEYQHQYIISGQWWRLLTGHIVHLGPIHTALNLAGFWLIINLVGEQRSLRLWCLSFTFIALGTSVCMLWLNPKIGYYAGLSGVLHGLLVFGLLPLSQSNKLIGWGGLCIVCIKLTHEQIIPNSTAQTAALIDAPVVSIAHFYGAILGFLLHLLLITIKKYKHS